MPNNKPYIIAIAGPSGCGKSYLTNKISKTIDNCLCISIDNYFLGLPLNANPNNFNFDNPKYIDWSLLITNITDLLKGKTTKMPVYSFLKHKRDGYTEISPNPLIIIEGIYSLFDNDLNKLFNKKIYLNIDKDICLIRRIQRDIKERGHHLDGIINQYLNTVRPMLIKNIIPQKNQANLVIENENFSIIEFILEIKNDFQTEIKDLI